MENRLLQSPQIEASDSSAGEESFLISAAPEILASSAVSESSAVPGESEALEQDSDNGQTALSDPSSGEYHRISDPVTDKIQPFFDEPHADKILENDTSRKDRKKRNSRVSKAPQTFPPVSMGCWFVTLMCMNIPIIGWIYLLILVCSRSAGARRSFAKAYLLYKFIFLLITLAILAVAVHYGLEVLDQVLAYMEML